MPATPKKIDLIIKSEKDPKSSVPAVVVAEKFQSIQNLLYLVGDQLEGHKYRSGGDFPNTVKERFTLLVRNLKMGSIDATLEICDDQQALPDLQTRGEEAIAIVNTVVSIAQTEQDISSQISKEIPDLSRAFRCIQELDQLWPDSSSPFSVKIGFGRPRIHLNPLRKPVIQQALRKIPEPMEKTIVGRLIQLRVDKKHECRIDTPEGEFLCKYHPEMEKTVIGNIGNIVSIIGQLKDKSKIEIASEKAIEQIQHITLSKINFRDQVRSLKVPLIFNVQYEDDQYIIANDLLHLLVTSPSLKEAVRDIEEEFAELWKEYVEVNPGTLTKDAIEFRSKLKALFIEDGDTVGYA